MKYIPIFMIIIVIYMVVGGVFKNYKIPDEAIRIRVIANSNSDYDQQMKRKVKDSITSDMYQMLNDIKGIDQARNVINSNLDIINQDVFETLKKNNYQIDYDVNFGYNYFPEKKFKGLKYDAGYYESLVVTLGEGKGDNWWCVLFPPICMLEASDNTDVEYTTLAKEMVSKYF